MNYEFWLNEAQKRLLQLGIGQEFKLKDLFSVSEWKEEIGTYIRSFGTKFSENVTNRNIIGVEKTGKSNKPYRRISINIKR